MPEWGRVGMKRITPTYREVLLHRGMPTSVSDSAIAECLEKGFRDAQEARWATTSVWSWRQEAWLLSFIDTIAIERGYEK